MISGIYNNRLCGCADVEEILTNIILLVMRVLEGTRELILYINNVLPLNITPERNTKESRFHAEIMKQI